MTSASSIAAPSAREELRSAPGKPETHRAREALGSFYHPELDGLRFFAFLAVFLLHAFSIPLPTAAMPAAAQNITHWLRAIHWAGTAGVDVFFVLSGYLITELLRREYQRFGNVDLPRFYARRSLRIWPLYFLFLGTMWLCESHWLALPAMQTAELILFALFLGNWSTVKYGFPASTSNSLWTVSIEEQFYTFWPLLVWRFTRTRIAVCAVAVLFVCTAVRAWGVAARWSDVAIYVSTFTHIDGLACGALLSALLQGRTPRLSKWARRGLFALGLAGPVIAYRWYGAGYHEFAGWNVLVLYPAIAASALLIVLSTLRERGESPGITGRAWCVWLGRISYGLYVYHRFAQQLVFVTAQRYYEVQLSVATHCLASLAVTILFATMSWYLLERPFLRWKERFNRSSPIEAPIQRSENRGHRMGDRETPTSPEREINLRTPVAVPMTQD